MPALPQGQEIPYGFRFYFKYAVGDPNVPPSLSSQGRLLAASHCPKLLPNGILVIEIYIAIANLLTQPRKKSDCWGYMKVQEHDNVCLTRDARSGYQTGSSRVATCQAGQIASARSYESETCLNLLLNPQTFCFGHVCLRVAETLNSSAHRRLSGRHCKMYRRATRSDLELFLVQTTTQFLKTYFEKIYRLFSE